jgi:hypothetical protein
MIATRHRRLADPETRGDPAPLGSSPQKSARGPQRLTLAYPCQRSTAGQARFGSRRERGGPEQTELELFWDIWRLSLWPRLRRGTRRGTGLCVPAQPSQRGLRRPGIIVGPSLLSRRADERSATRAVIDALVGNRASSSSTSVVDAAYRARRRAGRSPACDDPAETSQRAASWRS